MTIEHPLPAHPGLAKVRSAPPFSRRVLRMLRCADALWASWFEHLDTISEGAVTRENSVSMYRGTTSVIVLTDQHGGALPFAWRQEATLVATRDPHFWLRALRVARREAASRVSAPLDCIHVQLLVRQDRRGIRADVEVEARVLSDQSRVKQKR